MKKLLESEARNSTAGAISCGSPTLRKGVTVLNIDIDYHNLCAVFQERFGGFKAPTGAAGDHRDSAKYLGVQLSIAPLAEPSTVIFALIVVNIWQWTGFSMIMYVVGINSIPSELFDAALIDGAHGFSLVTRIVVPLLSPVTRSQLLLGIIGTLQTFPIVYLMTDGGPDHASEIFGTFIFKEGFVIGDTGYYQSLHGRIASRSV